MKFRIQVGNGWELFAPLLTESGTPLEFDSREDAIEYIQVTESLPIPYGALGVSKPYEVYVPDNNNQVVAIVYQEQREWN